MRVSVCVHGVQLLWSSLVSDHGADGGICQVELPSDVGRVRLHRHRQNNSEQKMILIPDSTCH